MLPLPTNATATVPLVFADQFGLPAPAPTGGAVSTSDTSIATAALSADGASVTVTPVAAGSVTVTYQDGTLSAALDVTVSAPVATTVTFGDPVVTPNPPQPAASDAPST